VAGGERGGEKELYLQILISVEKPGDIREASS